MSTDTQKYSNEHEKEVQHSAFEEFGRDERRPAVLLLGGLIIAAIFFALGIMFGRWTERQPTATPAPANNQATPVNRPTPSPTPSPSTTRQTARPSPRR